MLKLVGVVLLAIPMALLALVGATGLMIVDVREASGHHIVVPVPLMVADAAFALAPQGGHHGPRMHLDRAKVAQYLPLAHDLVRTLASAPDAELVAVDDHAQHVRISKAGAVLQVRVNDGRDDVAVDVPIAMVEEILSRSHGGEIAPRDLVGVLGHARFTKLADVQSGDDHVKITVW